MNTRTPERGKGRERVGQCVWDRSTTGRARASEPRISTKRRVRQQAQQQSPWAWADQVIPEGAALLTCNTADWRSSLAAKGQARRRENLTKGSSDGRQGILDLQKPET